MALELVVEARKVGRLRVGVAAEERRLRERLAYELRHRHVGEQHELLHHRVGRQRHVQPHRLRRTLRCRHRGGAVVGRLLKLHLGRGEAERAAGDPFGLQLEREAVEDAERRRERVAAAAAIRLGVNLLLCIGVREGGARSDHRLADGRLEQVCVLVDRPQHREGEAILVCVERRDVLSEHLWHHVDALVDEVEGRAPL